MPPKLEDVIAQCRKDASYALQVLVNMPPVLTPWSEEIVEIEEEGRRKPRKVKVWERSDLIAGDVLIVFLDDDSASWAWEFREEEDEDDDDPNGDIPGGDGFGSPQAAMEAADAWAKEEELLLAPGKPEDYEPQDGE